MLNLIIEFHMDIKDFVISNGVLLLPFLRDERYTTRVCADIVPINVKFAVIIDYAFANFMENVCRTTYHCKNLESAAV